MTRFETWISSSGSETRAQSSLATGNGYTNAFCQLVSSSVWTIEIPSETLAPPGQMYLPSNIFARSPLGPLVDMIPSSEEDLSVTAIVRPLISASNAVEVKGRC